LERYQCPERSQWTVGTRPHRLSRDKRFATGARRHFAAAHWKGISDALARRRKLRYFVEYLGQQYPTGEGKARLTSFESSVLTGIAGELLNSAARSKNLA
jgi:hypothetical protein